MKHISLVLLFLGLILVSCSEDDAGMNMAPKVTLNGATDIYRTGFTLSATVKNEKNRTITESGFIYSTTKDFQNLSMDAIRNSSSIDVVQTDEPVSKDNMQQTVTSLSPNTVYYYCAYVSSGYSVERSDIDSVSTVNETAPILTNLTVSNLTTNSCTLSFQLTDIGGEDQAQTLEIWYKEIAGGSTPSSLVREECDIVDASAYMVNLTNLTNNTRYAACAHIITTTGRVASSAVTTFTTDNVVVNFSDLNLTPGDTWFTAQCAITTSEEVVAEGVFYSREVENPTENNFQKKDDVTDKNVSVTVDGLTSNGTYYVRPYAVVQKNGTTVYTYGRTKEVNVNGYVEPLAQLTAVSVDAVTSSSITVSSGFIGNPTVKEYGFCYLKGSGTPTIESNSIAISSGKPFTATLYALDADADYTIRAYAVTDSGVGYSTPVTQRTNKKTPSSDDNVFPEK